MAVGVRDPAFEWHHLGRLQAVALGRRRQIARGKRGEGCAGSAGGRHDHTDPDRAQTSTRGEESIEVEPGPHASPPQDDRPPLGYAIDPADLVRGIGVGDTKRNVENWNVRPSGQTARPPRGLFIATDEDDIGPSRHQRQPGGCGSSTADNGCR